MKCHACKGWVKGKVYCVIQTDTKDIDPATVWAVYDSFDIKIFHPSCWIEVAGKEYMTDKDRKEQNL